jgi:hypothetical protein
MLRGRSARARIASSYKYALHGTCTSTASIAFGQSVDRPVGALVRNLDRPPTDGPRRRSRSSSITKSASIDAAPRSSTSKPMCSLDDLRRIVRAPPRRHRRAGEPLMRLDSAHADRGDEDDRAFWTIGGPRAKAEQLNAGLGLRDHQPDHYEPDKHNAFADPRLRHGGWPSAESGILPSVHRATREVERRKPLPLIARIEPLPDPRCAQPETMTRT